MLWVKANRKGITLHPLHLGTNRVQIKKIQKSREIPEKDDCKGFDSQKIDVILSTDRRTNNHKKKKRQRYGITYCIHPRADG